MTCLPDAEMQTRRNADIREFKQGNFYVSASLFGFDATIRLTSTVQGENEAADNRDLPQTAFVSEGWPTFI